MNHADEEEELRPVLESAKRAGILVKEIQEISERLSARIRDESEGSKERAKALRCLHSVAGGDSDEHDRIESSIAHLLDSTNDAVQRLDRQCKILISNQRGTEEKIRRKHIDLERTEKRLESLRHVRPAYMDEYEQLEDELRVQYEQYVVKIRNKDWLEGELASFRQAAVERQRKTERSMKRMQQKFREEELRVLTGGDDSEVTSVSHANGDANAPATGMPRGEVDKYASIDEDDSRTEASSSSSAPRHGTSFGSSDDSLSEPSAGSELGSDVLDDDDSDDNF